MALNKGSNVHYLLARVLESAGVPFDQVRTVFLAPSDARAAFEGGSVDAWAVWDPYLAEAEVNAGARLLVDASHLVANREFHLASRQLALEHPLVIRAILAALGQEGEWARGHRDEVARVLAAELRLEKTVVQRTIDRKVYGIAAMTDDVIAEQQRIADLFYSLGLISKPIVVRETIMPGLLGDHPESVDLAAGRSATAN